MTRRRFAGGLAALGLASAPLQLVAPPVSAAVPEPATSAAGGLWQFEVTLDGKPVGEHRFEVLPGEGADAWSVHSEARYRVTLLGIPVYRYAHLALERWQGGCLRQLNARTDDNGQPLTVRAEAEGEGLRIQTQAGKDEDKAGASTTAGCLMSYAYWRPDLVRQSRLLNPQTGRVEAVRFAPAGTQTLPVDGKPQPARGWQLSVAGSTVVVWYLPSGRWVGLDATVAGDRQLRYRLAG